MGSTMQCTVLLYVILAVKVWYLRNKYVVERCAAPVQMLVVGWMA
jgi:hypothetical protein